MKILFIILSMTLATSVFAQNNKPTDSKCDPGKDQYKCGVNSDETKPEKPVACKIKCKEINDLAFQKACYRKCDRPSKPHDLLCEKKCNQINDVEKQKACHKSCGKKKPKKKAPSELSGCEKSDAVTITCADGVYVKSAAVNNSETIKEILEPSHHEDAHSGASEQ